MCAIAGMAWGALAQPAWATMDSSAQTAFLDETENLRTKDHPQFVQRLEQIQRDRSILTPTEQWRLRYLEAWETMFSGDYAKSEAQLQDVVAHSGDSILAAKASALLLSNLGANRRYEAAFALANRMTTALPKLSDMQARFTVQMNLSQMLNLAGQTDLAIKYARMMEEALPPGETLCRPLSLEVAALYNAKQLASSSDELHRAIDTCVAAGQPVIANTMWLVLASVYLNERQAAKLMALLDRIGPSIRQNQYYPHILSAQVLRAQAFALQGNDNDARKAALSAVGMAHADEIGEWLKEAYQVLYDVEKKRGNSASALSYYEHYVAQDKGDLNDITARSLAYEVSQQQLLVQNLETESLSKQNNILRLKQALDVKAVETSRLYIILLLLVLAFIAIWLIRLKRSQLRFMKLSSLDGLTGIFNHQHFMSEAERILRIQEKKLGSACLVSIDIDHFKQVNDTHGHAMGDIVLQHTVAVLQEDLRPIDLFARLGGEEFGILLVGCTSSQAMATAQRLRIAIESAPVEDAGQVISLSVSVGVASTDRCGYQLSRLFRESDAALYRAKRAGRNRVVADTDPEEDTLSAA
jgi:diguanylate cyclase (GGDEF)-like protein